MSLITWAYMSIDFRVCPGTLHLLEGLKPAVKVSMVDGGSLEGFLYQPLTHAITTIPTRSLFLHSFTFRSLAGCRLICCSFLSLFVSFPPCTVGVLEFSGHFTTSPNLLRWFRLFRDNLWMMLIEWWMALLNGFDWNWKTEKAEGHGRPDFAPRDLTDWKSSNHIHMTWMLRIHRTLIFAF